MYAIDTAATDVSKTRATSDKVIFFFKIFSAKPDSFKSSYTLPLRVCTFFFWLGISSLSSTCVHSLPACLAPALVNNVDGFFPNPIKSSLPPVTKSDKLSIKLIDGMHHCWICGLKGKTLQFTIKKYNRNRLSEYCRIFEEEDYNSKLTSEEECIDQVRLPSEFIPIATTIPNDPDHVAVVKYLMNFI